MNAQVKDKKSDTVKATLVRLRIPIASLLFAVAIVLVWDAWNQGAAGRAAQTVAAEGKRLQSEEGVVLTGLLNHFEQARNVPGVVDAIAGGDIAGATKAFSAAWPEAREVQFVAPDLDAAFAAPAKFGYGRIAVLDAALRDGTTRVAVARVAGKPMLVLAGAIRQNSETKSLATVALPIESMSAPIAAAHPGDGYLALNFHGFDVARKGNPDVALLGKTENLKLVDNGFLLQASSPRAAESLIGLSPIIGYVLALLLALAGAALWRFGKRMQVAAAIVTHKQMHTTLTDMLALEAASAPASTTAERKIVVAEKPKKAPVAIERSIFRAYDIRGVVGETLDAGVAKLIGQAIGTAMQAQGLKEIVVGRDGRLSGPDMAHALIEGLRASGRDVIDIGLAPTPLVYFAAFQFRTGSCVAVTGSHNPPDYNGFKIVLGGETLSGDSIQALYASIAEDRLYSATAPGGMQTREVAGEYVNRVSEDVQLERKLKVVVDAGNGVAGMLAPEVLEAIGAEVAPIFCEVDGKFPNHHPDPSEPQNLTDLIQMVARLDADIGIAFDGDGDRIGVVTRKGEIVFPDRVLMLLAADVLERNPGAVILYDVKCTGHLASHILRHGGSPLMWKTGHSLMKAKMKETGAELAGEMSGHFFFKERWYGFDDGIYAAARLLEILATHAESPDDVFATLPKGFSTAELKVTMAEGANHLFIDRFREQARFEGARIVVIDGVRADWPDGWGLVRASNTTPSLVLRFDADTPEALTRIQEAFRSQLLAVQPDLALPF
jgi:phosphomannomutase/phosphoglucomutase